VVLQNTQTFALVCLYASISARFLKQSRRWEKNLPTRKH